MTFQGVFSGGRLRVFFQLAAAIVALVPGRGATFAATITSEPVDRIAFEGDAVMFQVTATGDGALAYQWLFDGDELTGETGAMLSLASVDANDAGLYSVRVTDTGGPVTSREARLGLIDTASGGRAVDAGNMTGYRASNQRVVNVLTTGSTSGGIWGTDVYTDDTHVGTAAVHMGFIAPGETAVVAVLILPGQSSYSASSRNGVSSSSWGAFAGSYSILGVVPSFSLQPSPAARWEGAVATFDSAATGPGNLTYQWFRDGNPLGGETGTSLTLSGVGMGDAGQYHVVAANEVGPVVGETAELAVVVKSAGDAAISVPGSMSVFRSDTGQVKRVTLTGSSGGVVWGSGFYTDDTGLSTAAVHAGLLQPGETGTVAVWIGPGQSVYRSTLQNGVTSSSYGSFPGSYAFLARVPHVTAQPTPRAVWAGDSVTFAVQASGSGALGYQWRRDGVDLDGATASTLTVADVGAGEVGAYDVVITDSEGCVVSAQAEIPFAQSVVAVQSLSARDGVGDLTGNEGAVYAFPVTGSDSGPLWGTLYYTTDSSVGLAAVHGGWLTSGETATLAVIILAGRSSYPGTTHNGVSSSETGSYPSSFAIIGRAPELTSGLETVAIEAGGDVTLSPAVSGQSLTYAWSRDGSSIPGESGSSLVLNGVQTGDGGLMRVTVSNATGSVYSEAPLYVGAHLFFGASGELILYGQQGLTYDLQSNGVLGGGVWATQTSITVTGTPMMWTDPAGMSGDARFYRTALSTE